MGIELVKYNKNSNGNVELTAPKMGGAVKSVNGYKGDVVLTHEDVGALPKDTVIPTKVSELENDNNYLSSIPNEYITEEELNNKELASKEYVDNAINNIDIPQGEQVQADWNQNNETAPDYVKNKPNKLTSFENDLFYANKEDCILDISLKDCQEIVEEFGTYYRYTIPFPQSAILENFKIEACGIYDGYTYKIEKLKKDIDMAFDVDGTNCCTFWVESFAEDESVIFMACEFSYGLFDVENESYINDGNLYLTFGIMDDDSGEYFAIEYFNCKFIRLEDKKIKKECLDIPKEVTDLFVITYDWEKEDFTAHYNEMREAKFNDKQLMLYDEYNEPWQYSGCSDDAVTFMRLRYTQSSPKGQRYSCDMKRFKPSGEVESDFIHLG